MTNSTAIRSDYLLDPHITFLNHGSFGACPRPVFEQYQRWQRELEYQPVEFLGRRFTDLLAESRASLARYLGAAPEDILYFQNPTTALNMVIHNVALQPGDEVLATDHEYGALDRAWMLKCKQTGAVYKRQPIPLPQTLHAQFVETFWAGVTNRTRVIFISHLTSATALIFPVEEIVRRARARGILTIIDGAHAPGQLALDLRALGCDAYAGACHKWLGAPKGAGFLYARPEVQAWLNPLVVSWGWGDETIDPSPGMGETRFVRFHQWQGTRDVAAFLSVPAAIEYQRDHGWDEVRERCHNLALYTRDLLTNLTGLAPISPEHNGTEVTLNGSPYWFGQLVAVPLPQGLNLETLKTRLYEEFQIEVPVQAFNDLNLIRVSFQAYNSEADGEALAKALKICFQGTV